MDQPRIPTPVEPDSEFPRDVAAEIERARADGEFVERVDRLAFQHAETLERLAE